MSLFIISALIDPVLLVKFYYLQAPSIVDFHSASNIVNFHAQMFLKEIKIISYNEKFIF